MNVWIGGKRIERNIYDSALHEPQSFVMMYNSEVTDVLLPGNDSYHLHSLGFIFKRHLFKCPLTSIRKNNVDTRLECLKQKLKTPDIFPMIAGDLIDRQCGETGFK